MTCDDALRELYQAPHERFIAERKHLADDLRAAGDRAAATKIAKLTRPTISAWVVNQLYWHARDQFDEMLAAAARLREGDLAANAAYRDAIARLRRRASNILADAGHAATEATQRRVTTNLSAIAAIGNFDPDPPGALGGDRDAPGFEVVAVMAQALPTSTPKSTPPPGRAPAASPTDDERQAAERQRLDERRRVEERRREAERARRRGERERVAATLRTAKGELEAHERRVQTPKHELKTAEAAVEKQRAVIEDLERKLMGLPEPD